MKNILTFLLIFFVFSCSSSQFKSSSNKAIDCPAVFFASDHKNYIHSSNNSIDIDNLSFSAEINNFAFNNSCFEEKGLIYLPLEILFIINPINLEDPNVYLPFYIAILDDKENLKEIYYYSIDARVLKDEDKKNYIESEISESILVKFPNDIEISSLLVGFMLDNDKYKVLN